MPNETATLNMEYVIVRGGCAIGMATLSAEDTDRVCDRLGIRDRSKVLLVRDYDAIDPESVGYYLDSQWDALVRIYS